MSEDREVELERFRQLRATEDKTLRGRIIEDHLWLAKHAARRFNGRGEPSDDLVQVASLALVKAVDRFDPAQEVRFSTFAMPTIVGELRRHFRDKTWSMRVSRRLKDLHLELRSASEQLTHTLGRAPSVDELAEFLDTTAEEVLEALEAGASYRSASLEQQYIGADSEEVVLPGAEDEEIDLTSGRLLVQEAMAGLSQRDRRVLYLRYYLEMTQAEIAAEVGVSQVHVSRILRSTLSKLGDELDDV